MKKAVYTVFVAFWSCALTIASLDAMSPENGGDRAAGGVSVYTLADVAEHDGLDDCWMAIEGKVYDFTGYIGEHPTPPSVLEPWCGTEATEGMRTKGYGRDHSSRAWERAKDFLIGELAAEQASP